MLFGLVEVGAYGGPSGELAASAGGELADQSGDGGQVRQHEEKLVRAEALGYVCAGGGQGVGGYGDVVLCVVVCGVGHESHPFGDEVCRSCRASSPSAAASTGMLIRAWGRVESRIRRIRTFRWVREPMNPARAPRDRG